MATVTNADGARLGSLFNSLSTLQSAGPGDPRVSRGAEQIVVNPGTFVSGPTFTGTGFTFDAAGRPAGGTVTDVARPGNKVDAGYGVSGLQIPLTTLYAAAVQGAGEALLPGVLSGNDTIIGGNAGETVRGYDGDDLFRISSSPGPVDGGAGVDTVHFNAFAADLRADFTVEAGSGTLVVGRAGASERSTYTAVEAIRFDDGTLSFDADTAGGQVYILFQAALGRAPGAAELGYFTEAAERHDLPAAAAGLLATPEARAEGLPGLDGAAFVDAAYRAALGRGADPGGLEHWQGRFAAAGGGDAGRGAVLAGIAASDEAEGRFAAALAPGVFGADPDTVGSVRANLAVTGAPAPGARSLASYDESSARGHEEYLARYSSSSELSDADFVALLIRNSYGADATDSGAVAYYTQALASGAGTRADVIHAYASSPGIDARVAPYITDGGVLLIA